MDDSTVPGLLAVLRKVRDLLDPTAVSAGAARLRSQGLSRMPEVPEHATAEKMLAQGLRDMGAHLRRP
jgi:hypothetical protein